MNLRLGSNSPLAIGLAVVAFAFVVLGWTAFTRADNEPTRATSVKSGATSARATASAPRSQALQELLARRKAASAAFVAVMEHEGKDCPDAHTQYDWNICLSKAVDAARKQFDVFYGNIMSILAPGEPADRPDRQRLLKDSQELWIQYRNATVKAIGEEWSTGTGRPSAEMQGELLLLRARMRELEFTYDGALHR